MSLGGAPRPQGRGRGLNPNLVSSPAPVGFKEDQQEDYDEESEVVDSSGSPEPSEAASEGQDSDEEEPINAQAVVKALAGYGAGGGGPDVGRTKELLLDQYYGSNTTCLVCLEGIKHAAAIWSCTGCHVMLHLPCAQRWSREGTAKAQGLTLTSFPDLSLPWCCPKCRREYAHSAYPAHYLCYCGKTIDPPFDPWILPHSCGDTCQKLLPAGCGHRCRLLCHPGPCPPCPLTVTARCHCGRGEQKSRCGTAAFSCDQVCSKTLECGHHQCLDPCHPGPCAPCQHVRPQTCQCGKTTNTLPCRANPPTCGVVCDKPIPCGHHNCDKTCHSGPCGDCPKSGARACPCGKEVMVLPCTEDVKPCGDTCGKPLKCGLHFCHKRCHAGPCDECTEKVEGVCRCGQTRRMAVCGLELLCDRRCNRLRGCARHPCRRKCCDGQCPTCSEVCGKRLGCFMHKCTSVCHTGPCYPCQATVDISCPCGKTVQTLPCGAQRHVRKPRCPQPCSQPPDCHHPAREKHHCHSGSCPPCQQPCGRTLPSCPHPCPRPCHGDTNCPPCDVIVQVPCMGGHTTLPSVCSQQANRVCEAKCGAPLPCTHHTCTAPCHPPGPTCLQCTRPCALKRTCPHPCPQKCHPGTCAPCIEPVQSPCHCRATTLSLPCAVTSMIEPSSSLWSCASNCPHRLGCGHACPLPCHAAPCDQVAVCERTH